MIKFRCPHCEQKLGVPDEYAGKRVRCNQCQKPCGVPASKAEQPVIQQSITSKRRSALSRTSTQDGLSQSRQKITMDDIAAEGSRSVQINFQSRLSVDISGQEGLNEFDDPGQLEEDPRQAAIRLARESRNQSRAAKVKSSGGTSKKKKAPKDKISKNPMSGFSLSESVPELLRLPVGILSAVVCIGITVVIWIMCSRATESALCFVALFIPMVGAAGLKLFIENRTFLLGLLAIVIGGVGIGLGKLAIAKYVVMPYFEEKAHQEILVDLDALLADEKLQLEQKYTAKTFAQHGEFLYCCALASLVDDGEVDPVKARALGVDTLRASNITNVYTAIIDPGGEAYPSMLGELDAEDEAIKDKASDRAFQWMEEETDLRMTRKYFPALAGMANQCELQRMLHKPEQVFQWALISTFGIFDSLWILLGLGLGYVSVALE